MKGRVQSIHMAAAILMLLVTLAWALALGRQELPKSFWYTYAVIIVAVQTVSCLAGRVSMAKVRDAAASVIHAVF